MNEKRTLKAWTKEEREQLEKCKKSGHFAMLNARDLMQAVQYGFMLVAMTIINKK